MKPFTEYQPLVSIVIPVRNGERTLDACLRSIRRSYYKNYEVIVVDDHSTDNSVGVANNHRASVYRSDNGSGANNARNFGAKQANGEILVFIDSDIVLARETLLGIIETLEEDSVDAVVGLYTARHRHESFVSQYKNLWVRYSYMKSLPAIDWLFGAISGIKRPAFEKIGGFDAGLLARHGHDDIELGKRFARANLNIMLNMDIEVEHLKQYTIRSFVMNEFHRSLGFAELATKIGETAKSVKSGFVNVYPAFILSTLISLIVVAAILAAALGKISPWYMAGAVALYLALNIRFLNYLEQVRGLFAMMVMVPFLLLDHVVCFVGSVAGILRGLTSRR